MNKLRIKLLVAAFVALPFFGVKAFEWAPVGDAVEGDVTSYATTDGNYDSGDAVKGEDGLDSNGSFYAVEGESADQNTVDIYGTIGDHAVDGTQCPLKVDGDVVLGAVDADLTVNIKTPVTIEPYRKNLAPDGAPDPDYDGAQIIFETVAGKKITVNVDYDLQFRGITDDVTSGDADGYSDLYVIFKGAGQTIFKMADGTIIKFDGQMDESKPAEIDATTGLITPSGTGDYSANAGGTKVFVLMDQTAAQVNAGQNKVLFERKNDGDASMRTMIYIGPNSVFTYLSNNYQGLVEPDGEGIPTAGDYAGKFYAAVGIDVSNTKTPTEAAPTQGTGRMVLFIKGAYKTGWQTGEYVGGDEGGDPQFLQLVKKYPFNDGALVIAGHKLRPTDPTTPFDTPADFRTPVPGEGEPGFAFSSPAGVKAILRVVDNNAYTAATKPFAPTAAQRRGLLIINDCQNIGKYAADPYWDFYNTGVAEKYGPDWAYLNNVGRNVRLGCVLGINGVLDVYDSAFVDYVGGASNSPDLLALIDVADPSYLKKHNPSAFVVDGFDASLYSVEGEEHPFSAANSLVYGAAVIAPQIILRGNAKLLFKNAAVTSSLYAVSDTPDASTGFGPGYLFNFWARDPDAPGDDDLIADPNVDWNMTLAVGQFVDGVLQKAGYDGYQLAGLSNATTGIPYTKTGEGEHVLDVEGDLAVTTLSNSTVYADAYAATPAARNNTTEAGAADGTNPRTGVITLASVLTDYAGREINIATQTNQATYTTALVTRPLLKSDTDKYARYNSPGLFINGKVSLFNTTYAHTDASKLVTGKPEDSEPGMTGGERMFFAKETAPGDTSDPDRSRYPEFRLFNSELALHETLCASGLRFVVMDEPVVEQADATSARSNTSIIRFYDHGEALDSNVTGYGRLFMLGSELNLFESETPGPNYVSESAFLNVFKHNKPVSNDVTESSSVLLALRNGNEFPTGAAVRRAMHYIWMGIPLTTVANAQTGVFIGWPTVGDIDDFGTNFPVADSRSYPYRGEVFSADEKATYWFKLDAMSATLPAKQAELQIQGDLIGFNAMNNAGMGATVPVKDARDSGDVFVDYGGKLSISEQPVDVRAVTSLLTTYINTSVPFKSWNDFDYDGVLRLTFYSGFVDLPVKQVVFGDNYGTQPYGLTAAMIAADTEAQGYLRLPIADEATIAWFYRDPLIAQLAKSRTSIKRPDYLMYVGAGTDVKQLRVSGSTANDPMYMDVSGDGTRPMVARVREFATLKSTRAQQFIGEGEHGIIFAEYGGRFGLGSTEWNSNSVNAWNILGEDYVTIAPMGNCTIDVNEDVIIADDLPFMPTKRFDANSSAFGDFSDAEIAADTSSSLSHRMTIRSETEREIRVVRGTILDLTGFGQGSRRQEIAFGGKIKLVIEEGGGIRFPAAADVAGKGGVVLYFNDDSQLVFEGINEATPVYYADAASTDANRIRLFGKGQIWLNKHAQLKVMSTASVAVQADATTPTTDITISLQRQSLFTIGDANISGGVFQVGNTTNVDGAQVNFTLAINGADATFHTDREGFFGLGAGVVNKSSTKPNGSAAATNNPQLTAGKATIVDDLPVFNPDGDGIDFTTGGAWQVIPLFNVKNITVQLQNGIIEHKNIFNGGDSNASLWAVGPFSGTGTFKLNGGASAIVRGGGNIMLVPDADTLTAAGFVYVPVNVWDYAGVMPDTGEQYSILASGPLVLRRDDITTGKTVYGVSGLSFATTTAAAFFDVLAYRDYSAQVGTKYATVGTTQFSTSAAFVNKDNQNVKYPVDLLHIVRVPNPNPVDGKIYDGLWSGALGCQNEGETDPTRFAIMLR